MDENSSDQNAAALHLRLGDLSTRFHLLQNELLQETSTGQADKLRLIATQLIELSEQHIDQVLGELFLSDYSHYNFTKPLYVAASLVELIRRYQDYENSEPIDDDRRLQMVLGALGYNLGLLAYEKQVYESKETFSPKEKKQLRLHYPERSANILKAAGLDQALTQDIVRNHNVASDNPSKYTLMMRTPFIYAGIAMPQSHVVAQQSIENPSREFAQMFANRELDEVYGGLFLKINGLAPIGSLLKLESNEKALVIKGPRAGDIMSSSVRMLANRNGVQLLHPGEVYPLNKTPTRHRGLADHHNFAWTNFSAHEMWEK